MFSVGDKVKIDPGLKCKALERVFSKNEIDRTFEVVKVEDYALCSCGTPNLDHSLSCDIVVFKSYGHRWWVTIRMSDGKDKKISSKWLMHDTYFEP